MAESSAKFDFNTLSALDFTDEKVNTVAEKAKKSAVVEVPANIVALAQEALDKQTRVTRSFRGNLALATAFAGMLRNAGEHTNPKSSLTVVQDGVTVSYSAGERRGRKPNTTNVASDAS